MPCRAAVCLLPLASILLAACRNPGSTTQEPCVNASPSAAASDSGAATGFVPRRDVDAVEQPEGKRAVARLQRGRSYSLLKRGGPDRAWCKLDTGAEPGWVACDESEQPSVVAPDSPTPAAAGSGFAYYVLTLSWSPAFCATPAGAKSPEQCSSGRHYGFVVHGLWPQNERGWPESCSAAEGPSAAVVDRMLDLMPSEHLVRHEWERHGTCSGLSASDYFDLVRAAFRSIHVPDAFVTPKQPFTTDLEHVEGAFIAANPGLTGDSIAVKCKRELDEVSICLEKSLAPRRCGSDVRDACAGSVRVPPVR